MLAVGLVLIVGHFCLDPKVGLGPKHLVRLVSGLFQPTKLSKAGRFSCYLPSCFAGPTPLRSRQRLLISAQNIKAKC